MMNHYLSANRSAIERSALMDIVDSQRRSEMMAGIKGRNTGPEIVVRRIAHKLGLRFRLHRKNLPGRPDLVFPRYRLAVFVHGCFWHRHEGCRYAYTPKSRVAFWMDKFAENVARDRRNEKALQDLGWQVLVIWECDTRDNEAVSRLLEDTINRSATVPEGHRRSQGRQGQGGAKR